MKLILLFNSCIFNLFRIDLSLLNDAEQSQILNSFGLSTLLSRFIFRISIFSYKILNKIILRDFSAALKLNPNPKNTRDSKRNIFLVPFSGSNKYGKRLSIFLPNFCNKILRNNFSLDITKYKLFLNTNTTGFIEKFNKLI